jgi:hypothetical protein
VAKISLNSPIMHSVIFILFSLSVIFPAYTQKSKPMLRVHYGADARGNWFEESRILMTHDAQGRQIAFKHSMLSEDKSMWHVMNSEKVKYDNRGNQVFIEQINYQHNSGIKSQRTVTEMEYNASNQRIAMRSSFDYLISNQSSEYESFFEYDLNACLNKQNTIIKHSNGFQQSYRTQYLNDADCNVLVYEYFKTIGSDERLQSRKEFTYEAGMLVLEEEFLFDEQGEAIPATRKSYAYNASGKLTEQLEEFLFSDVPDQRFRYYYNEQDKLVLSTSEYLLKGSNDWTLSQQEEFNYNNLGLKSSEIRTSYLENFINQYIITFKYNNEKQIVEEKTIFNRTNDAGTILTFEHFTYYIYACDGRLLETGNSTSENFSSDALRKIVEIYPDRPACDPLPAIEVSVFPNPSNGLVYIVWNELQSEHNEITLLNAKGEFMQRYNAAQWQRPFEIDLTGLAEGIYYVRVKGSAGVAVTRVYLSK